MTSDRARLTKDLRENAMYIFDKKIGRLTFIKGLSAAGASALAASATGCARVSSGEHSIASNIEAQKKYGRDAGEWIPSCCNMCGGQDGIMVQVIDGVVNRIEPNHWNPAGYSNISSDFFEGYSPAIGSKEGAVICPKGNAGVMSLYDPDRILKPLKRTNPDRSPGVDPRFKEISWEQALDEVSAVLKDLQARREEKKLVWISEDHSFVNIQSDFCRLFGTPNYLNHSNICDVARKASFGSVMGDGRPLADFAQSKYFLIFGWNPTSALKWVHLPRIINKGLENGARMVVVDPHLSDTAAKAHMWVPIRPGTDGALALAIGHVIIRENLWDKEFVANWTVGFDEYSEYVKSKTPEWAEKMTTVPARTIEQIAVELGTTRPALVDAWSGAGQHSNGVQGGRAIAMLNALIGSYDRLGGMISPEKNGHKHMEVHPNARAEEALKGERLDDKALYPRGHGSGVYTQLFQNIADGKHYAPEVMFVVFQNPMMSVPGTQQVAKALQKIKTVVVLDTHLSETAAMADYVIPGSNYLERYDLNAHWVTWPVLGLRQPVVPPRAGILPEYETVTAIGRKLGLTDASGKAFFEIGPLSGKPIGGTKEWYEDYLSNEIFNAGPRMTLEELKKLPGAVWVDKNQGTRYEKYRQNGFKTATGKVQFVDRELAKKTDANGKPISALPEYRDRDWMPSEEYPLYFVSWKEASHTHSRTQNNAFLLDIKGTNPLLIHPTTAARYGLSQGDKVVMESPHGSTPGVISITERMHPEVVGMQAGFGHTGLGRLAKGRGTFDGMLRPTKADPISGMALHKETCVRLRKA
jgi:thiosulfate reductase/polysulfide reductase chain A